MKSEIYNGLWNITYQWTSGFIEDFTITKFKIRGNSVLGYFGKQFCFKFRNSKIEKFKDQLKRGNQI